MEHYKFFSSIKDDPGRMHDKILTYLMSLSRKRYDYTKEVSEYLDKVMEAFDSVKVK